MKKLALLLIVVCLGASAQPTDPVVYRLVAASVERERATKAYVAALREARDAKKALTDAGYYYRSEWFCVEPDGTERSSSEDSSRECRSFERLTEIYQRTPVRGFTPQSRID